MLFFSVISCKKDFGKEEGELKLHFGASYECFYSKAGGEKVEVPDTNDFILSVKSKAGKVIYNGKYGDSPEKLKLGAGSYIIEVKSCEFRKPEFSCPVYGDSKVAVIEAGKATDIVLECNQVNAGIRLTFPKDFLNSGHNCAIVLKSDKGSLMYGYKEDRIAYFEPGKIDVVMTERGKDKVLMTRTLVSREILSLGISLPKKTSESQKDGVLSISVDTTRNWVNEEHRIGEEKQELGTSKDKAISVAQIKDYVGKRDVWVYGYIVGGDMTSGANSISFKKPFKSASHIAIAMRSSVSVKSSCVAVQLNKAQIKDRLNLVSNPENLGKRVYLRGDIIASYYGVTGVKNVKDFMLR